MFFPTRGNVLAVRSERNGEDPIPLRRKIRTDFTRLEIPDLNRMVVAPGRKEVASCTEGQTPDGTTRAF